MRPALYPILFGGGLSSFDQFMSRQADGLYYDFTKTDRHFQENVGPTLADDVGEAIGLALDQRQWSGQTLAQVVAAASELVTNGTFDSATGWTTAANWSIGSGVATAALGTTGYLTSLDAAVVGKLYKITYDYIYVSGGGIQAVFGGTGNTAIVVAGSGTRTFYVFTTTTSGFQVFANNASATIDNVSVKLVPGIPGIQATGTLKPTRQTTGAKFDGTDDNLLTSYVAGTGANFIAALVTVPASIAAAQVFYGANDAASANRFYFAIDTAGVIGAGVGNQNNGTIKATADRRGTEVVVGLTLDASTVRLFDDASIGYEAAKNGSQTTTTALRLGANNNGGTAASFFGGSIKKLVAGREFLTLSRYLQIRNALLAA